MEYKVITVQAVLSPTKAIEKLVKAVNESIALGWEPLGAPVVTEHAMAAQAMIKRR